MSLSLDEKGPLERLGAWGMESGGLRGAAILTVALSLEAFASVVAHLGGVRIDAAAWAIVFCALELGLLPGLGLATVIGYLADLWSGQPRGLWWTGEVAAFALLRLFVVRVEVAGPRVVTVLSGLAAVAAALARSALDVGPGPGALPIDAMAAVVGAALLGWPAYVAFAWASNRFRSREETKVG